MKCPNCGHSLPHGSKFCPFCGCEAAPKRSGTNLLWLKIAFSISLVANVVLAGCLIYLQSASPPGQPVAPAAVSAADDAKTVSRPQPGTDKSVVYVTPQGKKYHKSNCSVLDGKTELKEYTSQLAAENAGYAPCGICFKK